MKKLFLPFVLIAASWLVFILIAVPPQVVVVKHPSPEPAQFLYQGRLWLIPLGLVFLIVLNQILGHFYRVRIFGILNEIIIGFNFLLVAYLIYLNF